MSGTSLDGVDAAFLVTDGKTVTEPGETYFRAYSKNERGMISSAIEAYHAGGLDAPAVREAGLLVSDVHTEAVCSLLARTGMKAENIDLVGFHGQTLFHAPKNGVTVQIGDGERLAKALGITVAYDFRSADVAASGEGAPLVPVFHEALLNNKEKPAAIINIGGVANVTIVTGDNLIAFDTGPGNALIDDWMKSRTSKRFDEWGRIAGQGKVLEEIVSNWLQDEFFTRKSPKSLDRNSFDMMAIDRASLADGAATLTAFSARAMAHSLSGHEVKTLYVSGGGAHNCTMMHMLEAATGLVPQAMDELGYDGDFVEAYAFAYLAARVAEGLPITFPGTTGVVTPLCGGKIAIPS